jgi:hypothetical protein
VKIPEDAFDLYVRLGPARSYRAVAEHYGVTKRAVTSRATRDGWQARLREIECRARSRADEELEEVLAEMYARHLRILHVIQGKALESLRALPLTSAWDAVKALDLVIERETKIRGIAEHQPSD